MLGIGKKLEQPMLKKMITGLLGHKEHQIIRVPDGESQKQEHQKKHLII